MHGLTTSATAIPTLVGIALCRPAQADPAYDRCIDQSGSTNQAWGACGSAWITREDVRLNTTWRQVYPMLEGDAAKALLEEQRAWITYKDASCRFYVIGDYGREGQMLHYSMCRAQVIAARTRDLEGLATSLKPGR